MRFPSPRIVWPVFSVSSFAAIRKYGSVSANRTTALYEKVFPIVRSSLWMLVWAPTEDTMLCGRARYPGDDFCDDARTFLSVRVDSRRAFCDELCGGTAPSLSIRVLAGVLSRSG